MIMIKNEFTSKPIGTKARSPYKQLGCPMYVLDQRISWMTPKPCIHLAWPKHSALLLTVVHTLIKFFTKFDQMCRVGSDGRHTWWRPYKNMQNEIVDQPQIEVDNCNDMFKSGYYSKVITIMLQFMQISLERVFIFFPLIQLCRDIPYSVSCTKV